MLSKNRHLSLVLALVAASLARAQVVSPSLIKDPKMRSLQVQYDNDLVKVGAEILAAKFEYPFYLSETLDLDLAEQQRGSQSSIRFCRYDERTVLAITGNYFAAYSKDKMSGESRARESFLKVVFPVLKAAVPVFQFSRDVQGYAVEISHHVIGSAMGVAVEQPENLMVFIPQLDAIRLTGTTDPEVQHSALLNGKAFLNGEPVTIWLSNQAPRLLPAHIAAGPDSTARETEHGTPPGNSSQSSRDTTPQALEKLQASRQQTITQLLKDLESQAHFVAYAPQNFVAFREGIYLELSMATNLDPSASGSRYRIAAMAFDEHIARLVRPVTGYFENETDFDGISFSSTVTVGGRGHEGQAEAVEFFFPFRLLYCYQKYDCTGQQLIDGGAVLVNGERISLDLEAAERF